MAPKERDVSLVIDEGMQDTFFCSRDMTLVSLVGFQKLVLDINRRAALAGTVTRKHGAHRIDSILQRDESSLIMSRLE